MKTIINKYKIDIIIIFIIIFYNIVVESILGIDSMTYIIDYVSDIVGKYEIVKDIYYLIIHIKR